MGFNYTIPPPLSPPPSYFTMQPSTVLNIKNIQQLMPNQLSKINSLYEYPSRPQNLSEDGFYQSFKENHFISRFFYIQYSNFLKRSIVRFFILGAFLGYLVSRYFLKYKFLFNKTF